MFLTFATHDDSPDVVLLRLFVHCELKMNLYIVQLHKLAKHFKRIRGLILDSFFEN